MNREQASNILDAYLLIWSNPNMDDASKALRDVILDAMTQYKPSTVTVPNITFPNTIPTTYPKITYTDNSKNWDVTTSVTCSGIDHADKQTTGAVS